MVHRHNEVFEERIFMEVGFLDGINAWVAGGGRILPELAIAILDVAESSARNRMNHNKPNIREAAQLNIGRISALKVLGIYFPLEAANDPFA